MAIPHVIHQIWLGRKPLPETDRAFRTSWATHHPSWELRLWTEENLPSDLRRPEVYERLRVPAERSDILRLELLWREGGVYVDTDFECLAPLDDLVDEAEFFVGDLKAGRINNAILGATAGHPLLDRALDELTPTTWYGDDIKAGSGPHFLDAFLRPHREEITVIPPEVFYPATAEQRAHARAVHHAARTWLDEEGLRYRLRKAEERAELADQELARLGGSQRRSIGRLFPRRRLR